MLFKKHAFGKGLVVALLLFVVLVLLARFSIARPFEVVSSSMKDTLQPNQVVFANALSYVLSSPARGDVVVFHAPGKRKEIKRIIGVPGDTVVIRGGWVYLRNGPAETKLDEPYLNAQNQGKTFRMLPHREFDPSLPITDDVAEVVFSVPPDAYFLMGDNRMASIDSRIYASMGNDSPFISTDALLGKVWFH